MSRPFEAVGILGIAVADYDPGPYALSRPKARPPLTARSEARP
jgi:hypothetical protein